MSRFKFPVIFFMLSAALAGVVVVLGVVALSKIKNSEAFAAAARHVESDSLVIQKFASIEDYGFFVTGSVGREAARLRFGFDGSIKAGRVECDLIKGPDGAWLVKFSHPSSPAELLIS